MAASFSDKFYNDFIKDANYSYMLKGLRNTFYYTIRKALLGIVIGFLLAVIRSNHDMTGHLKFLNLLANLYITVIRGTPTMVQLLIIYYIIFGSFNVNKIVVAISCLWHKFRSLCC